ncbi:Transferase [Corchorus olitorius]|uniref:Transferase n=1 Tax=Corchorus olitorius TaxID=93759 RepID=A0A1R3IFT4_9ROSI|nr:Transferase [Corchorus olitorius]
MEFLQHLKQSVAKSLTHFYPLAGRINHNSFVDCNDEGIPFKEAQVKCQLSDFLQNPVPEELTKLYPLNLGDASEIPMGIQLNTFDCGGIGLALCISHKIVDALSYFTFLNTWAAITRGDEKNVVLPELVSATLFPPENAPALPEPVIDMGVKNVVTKRFVFSAAKVEEIRAKYAAESENQKRPSRVESLSAFIWSRFFAVTKEKSSPDSFYMIYHTVNLRTRFEPPLPEQSFGNIYRVAVIVPDMDKNCDNLVSQTKESIRKIDKEFVRKLQLGENLKIPTGDEEGDKKGEMVPFAFSSLCRFPIYEADFGWGKPIWVGCASWKTKNSVVLMDTASGNGIEAWISLIDEDMAAFASDHEVQLYACCNN